MALLELTDECNDAIDRWDGKVEAPAKENRKITRLRVFKNPIIEHLLATSHPILPGVWFGPFITYGAYLALTGERGPWLGSLLYIVGVLAFTLIEYSLHRFIFHLPPGPRRSGKVRMFMIHGYHHQFPNDKLRLVAPPIMSWPIAAVLIALYLLVLNVEGMLILFGGTALGYLFYDWVHYYTHHFRNPKTRVGKLLRRAHAVHHHKLFLHNMGISSPLWDWVFGSFAWSDETVREALAETRALEAMEKKRTFSANTEISIHK